MIPNHRGKYKTEDIQYLGLPMFKAYECINIPEIEYSMDLWTITEFKELLDVTLTAQEKKFSNIKGFKSSKGSYGWSALYSMSEIMNDRGHNITYKGYN